MQDVGDDRFTLEEAQWCLVAFAIEHAANQGPNLGLGVFAPYTRQTVKIQSIEQILVNAALQLLICGVSRICSRRSRFHYSSHGFHRC